MIEDSSFHGNHDRRHIRRDYYNKNYNNPYFSKQAEKKANFNTKLYVRILLIIFLIYVVIYSDLFKVREVEIKGTDMIPAEEIRIITNEKMSGFRWLIFPKKNLMFLDEKDLSVAINNKYFLNRLDIDKSWQKLTIDLEEKPAYLIYNNLKSQYFLDLTGGITKEMTTEDISKYSSRFPTVYVMQDVKVGDKPVSARFVNFILELDKEIKAKNIKVKNYESGGVDQVNLVREDGSRIYFSINIPMSQSLENMEAIFAQKLRNQKFEYLDLRSGDKVYYK